MSEIPELAHKVERARPAHVETFDRTRLHRFRVQSCELWINLTITGGFPGRDVRGSHGATHSYKRWGFPRFRLAVVSHSSHCKVSTRCPWCLALV